MDVMVLLPESLVVAQCLENDREWIAEYSVYCRTTSLSKGIEVENKTKLFILERPPIISIWISVCVSIWNLEVKVRYWGGSVTVNT
jgi:hypothetical protein